jgi:hypothetical protein
MVQDDRNRDGGTGDLYRVRVAGRLPRNRWSWFGAESVTFDGSNTVFHVRVLDQSDLFGRLRKAHDLNLRLVSVEEMTGGMRGAEEAESGTADGSPAAGSQG